MQFRLSVGSVFAELAALALDGWFFARALGSGEGNREESTADAEKKILDKPQEWPDNAPKN